MPRFSPLLAAVALLCCACAPEQRSWLGALEPITPPAAAGSRFPHLASADDGRVIMSWLEPTGAGYTLRHARWLGASWGEAMTVTSGDDWFINWADFPSVVPVREGRLVAHWLQQSGSGVYSYDVRMAVSDDDGRTWTDSFTPHHDGTQSEHGFVTIFAGPDATGAVWLDGRHTAGGHDHAENAAGAMTLRSASIDDSGIRADQGLEIDGRVCDCCQTDAALTSAGPVVVYRDPQAGSHAVPPAPPVTPAFALGVSKRNLPTTNSVSSWPSGTANSLSRKSTTARWVLLPNSNRI